MSEAEISDRWLDGDRYEPFMGRWSRPLAQEFVRWLALPAALRWLDVGCGTGALTYTIVEQANPAAVQGVDPSAGFLEVARRRVRDLRVTFQVGHAGALPLAAVSVDAVVSGLVLNFVPKLDQAMQELCRVAQPGGVVAAYVWDYAGKMEFLRYFWDAAVTLRPEDTGRDEGKRFPLCHPDRLAALFTASGLRAVEVAAIDIPTPFRDFDDYWQPFLVGQFPAPEYTMALSEGDRDALRERLRATLPTTAGGSIPLMARAWAIRGSV